MDNANIMLILQQSLSADNVQLQQATAALKEAEERDLGSFVTTLLSVVVNPQNPIDARRQASLQLKNTFVSRDEAKEQMLQQRWLALEEGVRAPIRDGLLKILADPQQDMRSTAALAVGKLAAMEIPTNAWPNIVETLVSFIVNAGNPAPLRQASFTALGIICDDAGRHLEPKSSLILNAIAAGMHKDQTDESIKLAATRALALALDFVRPNFERPAERQQILALVGLAATQSTNVEVRVAAFQCLVEIASLYYNHLRQYMTDLFALTTAAIQREAEPVACQALEFWATVAEEELSRQEENEIAVEEGSTPPNTLENLIKTAVPPLAPLLMTCLTNQAEEINEETWDRAMAAGTCLGLFAQVVKDDIIPHILPTVEANISNPAWRSREAACLAFGFMLDGPSKKALAFKVKTLFPAIVQQLKDQHPHCQDTAAWTIGRICDLVPNAIEEYLPNLMAALLDALRAPPRIAANICWAIHNLAHRVDLAPDARTSVLSQYFEPLIKNLLLTAERPDGTEGKLMPCAYEAINLLINKAAPDVYPLVHQLIPVLCNKLQSTLTIQGLTGEERERQNQVQAHICGALQAIIQKLSSEIVRTNADNFMRLLLQVLSSKDATVHEEALMAIGALANKIEADFERYMPHFAPYLVLGLQNPKEYQVCTVAVGVVGDVCRAIEAKMVPFCDQIFTALFQNLQNPAVQRSVKPRIIECLGDIAMAIGGHFERYMPSTMMILSAASATKFDNPNADFAEYLKTLRESILAAYTGIVQGLHTDNKAGAFLNFLPNVAPFLDILAADSINDNDILYAATGLIGDIIQRVGPAAKPFLTTPSVRALLIAAFNHRVHKIRSAGQWAQALFTQIIR